MTPEVWLENLEARGIHLWADGGKLRFDAPVGALSEEDRTRLRAHKKELLDLLSETDPEPQIGAETCPVCFGALYRRSGKRVDRLECPAGHFSRWVDHGSELRIEGVDLIIPFSAESNYQYWRNGAQKLCEILAELGASIEVWRRHSALLTPNHDEICGGAVRQAGEVIFCSDCGRFAPAN